LLSDIIPKGGEEVEEIRKVARQTINALRDIVWFLDPAADDMEDLVARLKDTAKTLLPGIPFEFTSHGESLPLRASLNLRRSLSPILKELLHNVAKHSKAKRVTISVQITPQQLELTVQDDGVGFDPNQVRRSNGLRNLQQRADDLGGTLRFDTPPGGGTRATLTAPLT
jgi:two-component system, NarL family, sensor histidine kinase UhpB